MAVGQFFLGLLIVFVGFIFIWQTEWFLRNAGRIAFAEKWLGTEGGSRLMYKLIGTIIIIGGLLHANNLSGSVFKKIIKIVFRIDV